MGKRRTDKTSGSSVSQHLLRAALEHAYYQLERLKELGHQEYPFPGSKHLVEILLQIHEATIDELDSLLVAVERNPSNVHLEEDARIGARRFGYLLSFLHNNLQMLEFSSRTHISQASVHLIEGLTAKHMKKKKKFILMPDYEYNYSYRDIMAHILQVTADAFKGTNPVRSRVDNIAVLSYPNIFRENVLTNCLLGHEIGHFAIEQSQLVTKVMAELQLDKNLVERLVGESKTQKVGPQQMKLTEFMTDQFIRTQIIDTATSILHSWIDELAADVFAIRILGPVFVYSLERLLLTLEDLDKWSKDHPSARTRLQLLLDQNEKQGFMPELRRVKGEGAKWASGIISYFDQLQQTIAKPSTARSGTMGQLLENAVDRIKNTIIGEVEQTVENQHYQKYYAGRLVDDILPMCESLHAFVPPCDDSSGKPGDVVSILNAGMAFMISGKERYYNYFKATTLREELEAEAKISQLVSKGIELSYLERNLKK